MPHEQLTTRLCREIAAYSLQVALASTPRGSEEWSELADLALAVTQAGYGEGHAIRPGEHSPDERQTWRRWLGLIGRAADSLNDRSPRPAADVEQPFLPVTRQELRSWRDRINELLEAKP